MGVNIKGKNKKLFKTIPEKVQNLMKKRQRIYNVNGTKVKDTKHTFKKDALCCDVEVESNDDRKANMEATIYRPGGTITQVRKPKADLEILELLQSVIVCFLEKFLSGATEVEVMIWSSRNSKPITIKTAISKCNLCTFETKSKVALKRQYTIVHIEEIKKPKALEYTCTKCNNVFISKSDIETHIENLHVTIEKKGVVENLRRRIVELENIVNKFQQKEAEKGVTNHEQCYQFLKRPYRFEKETQKRPTFFSKRDLKETLEYQKKRPPLIFFLQLSYHFWIINT